MPTIEAVECSIVCFVYFVAAAASPSPRNTSSACRPDSVDAERVGDEVGTDFAALRHVGNLEVRVAGLVLVDLERLAVGVGQT